MSILSEILEGQKTLKKKLAVLVDPDKVDDLHNLREKLKVNPPDFILVGGSVLERDNFELVTKGLKEINIAPVLLFPGDASQISDDADGLLLLSLISGRNPEYLIGQQVKASKRIKEWGKEVLPTSYILLDGGKETAVQRVSQTSPIRQQDVEEIVSTALAGEQLGHSVVYLEAGSGADRCVSPEIVRKVKNETVLPIIVGGGIRDVEVAKEIWSAGADIIVIGTAFEDDINLLASFVDASYS